MSVLLPEPLLRGSTSSRTISDIMRNREERYEKLFEAADAGYEHLGHFYVPPFQRPAVWTIKQKQKLIESIWLGISIGSIVVSEVEKTDPKTGKYPLASDLLIDGQQRLRAIKSYVHEGLTVFPGTGHEHRWDDLDIVQKRRFNNVTIGYISIDHGFDMEKLKEVYNRLNFSGTPHTEDQRAQ
jgi:hypothetical protein